MTTYIHDVIWSVITMLEGPLIFYDYIWSVIIMLEGPLIFYDYIWSITDLVTAIARV